MKSTRTFTASFIHIHHTNGSTRLVLIQALTSLPGKLQSHTEQPTE